MSKVSISSHINERLCVLDTPGAQVSPVVPVPAAVDDGVHGGEEVLAKVGLFSLS